MEHLFDFKKISNKISAESKFAFIFSFIANLVVHMFIYVNPIFAYDSIRLFDESTGYQNGRFMVNLLLPLTLRMQMPWILGIIFSIFLALSITFVCKLLDIKSKLGIITVSLLFCTYPVIFSTNLFETSLAMFGYAIFAAIASVYCISKQKLKYYIFSGILLITSLGCYQAYIGLAISLFAIYLIKLSMEKTPSKQIWKLFIICVVTYAVSVLIYYGIWQITFKLSGEALLQYRGEDTIHIFSVSTILHNLIYSFTISCFQLVYPSFYSGLYLYIMLPVNLLINFFGIIAIFYSINKNKTNALFTIPNIFMFFICLVTGMSFVLVFSPYAPHSLMLLPFITPFLLSAFALEKATLPNKKSIINIKRIVVCLLMFSFALNILLGNAGYMKLNSDKQRTIALATRIVDLSESVDGVNKDTTIYLVASGNGWFGNNDPDKVKAGTNDKNETRGYVSRLGAFVIPQCLNGSPYVDSLIWYINDNVTYLGCEYKYENLETGMFKDNDNVKALEKFPSQNCYAWVDGNLVIRL